MDRRGGGRGRRLAGLLSLLFIPDRNRNGNVRRGCRPSIGSPGGARSAAGATCRPIGCALGMNEVKPYVGVNFQCLLRYRNKISQAEFEFPPTVFSAIARRYGSRVNIAEPSSGAIRRCRTRRDRSRWHDIGGAHSFDPFRCRLEGINWARDKIDPSARRRCVRVGSGDIAESQAGRRQPVRAAGSGRSRPVWRASKNIQSKQYTTIKSAPVEGATSCAVFEKVNKGLNSSIDSNFCGFGPRHAV
jgi:hypothetical protein